jgi:hypothetical protein
LSKSKGNSSAQGNPAEDTDVLFVLIIAGVWMVGCLLVLGLCAQAAAGDRALAERRVAAAADARRFARQPIDRTLSV